MVRNSDIDSANGYVWNNVYSGDGCPPGYTPAAGTACSPSQDAFGSDPAGTQGVIGVTRSRCWPQSPVTEEEPFLYSGREREVQRLRAAVQTDSTGPSCPSGSEAGSSLPLSSFFVANPATSVAAINVALLAGKNLVLTPGIYDLSAPIVVEPPGHGRPRPRLRHAGPAARQRGAHRAAERRA